MSFCSVHPRMQFLSATQKCFRSFRYFYRIRRHHRCASPPGRLPTVCAFKEEGSPVTDLTPWTKRPGFGDRQLVGNRVCLQPFQATAPVRLIGCHGRRPTTMPFGIPSWTMTGRRSRRALIVGFVRTVLIRTQRTRPTLSLRALVQRTRSQVNAQIDYLNRPCDA